MFQLGKMYICRSPVVEYIYFVVCFTLSHWQNAKCILSLPQFVFPVPDARGKNGVKPCFKVWDVGSPTRAAFKTEFGKGSIAETSNCFVVSCQRIVWSAVAAIWVPLSHSDSSNVVWLAPCHAFPKMEGPSCRLPVGSLDTTRGSIMCDVNGQQSATIRASKTFVGAFVLSQFGHTLHQPGTTPLIVPDSLLSVSLSVTITIPHLIIWCWEYVPLAHLLEAAPHAAPSHVRLLESQTLRLNRVCSGNGDLDSDTCGTCA